MGRRKTDALIRLAVVLMADPDGCHWGYDTAQRAHVISTTMYRILWRMVDDGWVTAAWEDPAETGGKRPPRRYYRVTPLGRTELAAIATWRPVP